MRRLPVAVLRPSSLLPIILSLVVVSSLVLTPSAFAAPPDRIVGSINVNQTVALAKSHHFKAQAQYDRGAVDPAMKLPLLTLYLEPSPAQQQELDQLTAQQQQRGSALYHKWLTPAQYADRFGLSQNDLTKITTWLTAEGFEVVAVGAGNNRITFHGTAGAVQKAFGTEIHNYEVDGERHFANATPVRLPAMLNGIVRSISGLHSFLPRATYTSRRSRPAQGAKPQFYDSDTDLVFHNYLAPGDLATIYSIGGLYSLGITGESNGVHYPLAIVGQTDVYLADINYFRNGFGLNPIPTTGSPNCATDSEGFITSSGTGCNTSYFNYVLVPGITDPGQNYGCGDLGEADLDIEYSGAVASEAQIVYVNAPTVYGNGCNAEPTGGGSVYDSLAEVISPSGGTTPLAPVVSMSYGYCELFATVDLESLLQQGNAEGVTIMNSAGDQAAAACDYDPPTNSPNYPDPPFLGAQYGLGVSYPASSIYVTGVGGTSISLADDSYPTANTTYWNQPTTNPTNGGTARQYIPEQPWNDVEEFVGFCQDPPQGSDFCSSGGGTPHWVDLTTSVTAQQVQEDTWIIGGDGGASNCWYENEDNVCLGSGPGPNGGGFPQPSWQAGLSVANAPAGVRWVPDVSMLASPYFPGYIWCTPLSELGGEGSTSSCASGITSAVSTYDSIVGGTSAASPVFAGVVALLNQYVVQNGIQSSEGLGNINPTLYQLAASNSTNKVFNSVLTGNNNVYCQATYPQDFPANIVCPSAGVFGFSATDYDSKTGYNLVNGLGSVNALALAQSYAAQGSSTTTVITGCTPNPANFGQSVTCTASVTTAGTATPTGTVTFYSNGNGAAFPSVGTLSGSGLTATASSSTTLLAAGTDSITATYSGDSNNAGSSSVGYNETVGVPGFTFTATSGQSVTLLAGQTATNYTFEATPTSASTFGGAVTFSCSTTGLPNNATCTFSPTSIAAGAHATAVTMSISTAGPNTGSVAEIRKRSANLHRVSSARPVQPSAPLYWPALPLAGVVLAGFAGRKVSKHSPVAGLCVALTLLAVLIACGGSNSAPVTVSVTPTGASLYPTNTGWNNSQSTQQFTATVANTSNTAVTWNLSCSPSPCGTLSSTGLYTTPAIASGLPTTVSITATSQADTTKVSTPAVVGLLPTTIPGSYTVTVTATEGGVNQSNAAPTVALDVN